MEDNKNEWNENIENLDEIKSYLIIPKDENFELQSSETLKFSYEFKIPENLDYNNIIEGNFAVNYNNEEISTPSRVYLTTENRERLVLDENNYEDNVNPEIIEKPEITLNPEIENELLENVKTKISGQVWIDLNSNGIKEEDEKTKSFIQVSLIDSKSGLEIEKVSTDADGKYEFRDIENGNYIILFEYDSNKYELTTYQKEGIEDSVNSDVISTIKDETKKAVTEIVEISNNQVSNIDMGLVELKDFELQLSTTVSKVIIQNDSGVIQNTYDDLKLAKTEIAGKDLSSSTAYIEYKITVENTGDISGYAKSIVDYIPQGLIFSSSINPDWYTGSDGNLYTTSLADKELRKGEKAEIKLILIKQMTEENTGLVNNTVEIVEDYNVKGLKQNYSTESSYNSADVLISVKTGEIFIYTSIMSTTVLLTGIVIFIIINKLKFKQRKEGGV